MKENLRALSSVILIILIGVSGYFAFNIGNKSNNISVTYMVDNKVYEEVKLTKEENKISSLPEAPYKEGYTFKYWEYNGKEFDINEEIKGSIKIVAVYEKDETTISPTPTVKPSNPVVTPKPNSNQMVEVTSISIPSSATIKVNEGLSLNVVVNPSNASNKTVTWTSSNTNIVIVSNGLIKGLKEGVATITAKSNNGKMATCKVTVNKQTTTNTTVDVTGISLNIINKTLKIGESISLTATISPSNATNKNVNWKSSNSKIATVDKNGKVTAITSGNVTITAETNNGKKAQANLTITGNRIHFINLNASADAILLESNGHFALIDAATSGASKKIATYLDKIGVNNIDFIIITHSHADHSGGMVNIMNKYNIKTIYMKSLVLNQKYVNSEDKESAANAKTRYNNIANTAKEKNIKIVYVDKDSNFKETKSKSGSVSLGNMKVYFFNTLQRMTSYLKDSKRSKKYPYNVDNFDYLTYNSFNGESENINSIVNLVEVNGYNALFGGDLNQYNVWKGIIDYRLKNKTLDIFKIGHHGYHNCTGKEFYNTNNNYNIVAKYYVVTNNIDRVNDNNKYLISDYQIEYPSGNLNSCFYYMANGNRNNAKKLMCNKTYYANNSSDAVLMDLTNTSIKVSGGGLGKNSSSRCK